MIPDIDGGAVHVLGIAGTAMASLAGLLTERGYRVTGSDQNVYPPMSQVLDALGIEVRSPFSETNVPEDCALVVVGNAMSRGNVELESILERRLPCVSMPETLKAIFLRSRRPLVVAGTHGKTTTSSLAAWLLSHAGHDPGFLIGGLPHNFPSSFRVGSGDAFVVEGDEYDSAYFDKGPKFMHYLPQVAILGNVEFDHADIYRDVDDVRRVFSLFVNLIPRNGSLIVGKQSPLAMEIVKNAPCEVESFAVDERADWTAERLGSDPDAARLRVRHHGETLFEAEGPYWGRGDVHNALAACAAVSHYGLTAEDLASGLSTFKGVRRRLELRGVADGVTVIDDFAHHPTAVEQAILGARRRFSERNIWAVFEPRSFTARSRIFQNELATALSHADRAVVAEVFSSARLPADQELSEEDLVATLERAGVPARFIPTPPEIVSFIAKEARDGDVVLVMSNGGFGGIHAKLLEALERR